MGHSKSYVVLNARRKSRAYIRYANMNKWLDQVSTSLGGLLIYIKLDSHTEGGELRAQGSDELLLPFGPDCKHKDLINVLVLSPKNVLRAIKKQGSYKIGSFD